MWNFKYDSRQGSLLLYLMLSTCSNITYAIIQMAQESANSSQVYLDMTLYICLYLISTHNYLLVYDEAFEYNITAHTDSDWKADLQTPHSQMGILF